jgi:cytoskeletal protein RodZ
VVGAGVAAAATAGSADALGAAAPPPGAPGAPVGPAGTALPYGTGPVESSSGGSKTGLLIGLGAAAVVLLVIGAIVLLASGNKGGDVQTAQTPTTQAAASGPADTKKAGTSTTSTSIDTSSTSTAPATATTAAPTTEAPTTITTIVAPTTVVTVAPTRPTVTVAPTLPPAQPGRIVATPTSGAPPVNLAKGQQFQIILQNVGGSAASCSLSTRVGKLQLVNNCSPSVPAGATVKVTVQASNIEGNDTVFGAMEGVGSYQLDFIVR